jgi:hypothetical protein
METSISLQSDFSTYPIFLIHIGKKLVERVIVEVIIVKLHEYCFATNLTKHP